MNKFLLVSALTNSMTAAPRLWTLSGVTFDDGGTASGSFVYDATTNTYSGVNVTTTAGSVRPGVNFTYVGIAFGASRTGPDLLVVQTVESGYHNGLPAFAINFAAALDDGGGTRGISGTDGTCLTANTCPLGSPFRRITSGTVVGTVVPPQIPVVSIPVLGLLAIVLAGSVVALLRSNAKAAG